MNKKEKTYLKIGAVSIVVILLAAGAIMFQENDNDTSTISKMGTVLDSAAQCGLAVPTSIAEEYDLVYISDLEEYADLFGSEIIGIDAGAGIMSSTEEAIENYGLDSFTLVTSSEAAMLASLESAIDSGEAIAVTMWEPHWANGAYELTYLKDPDLVYGEGESIESWGRPNLASDEPVIAQILANYEYDISELNSLLSYIEDSDEDIAVAAGEWVENNPELLAEWLEGIEYESNRGSITIGLVDWADAMGTSNVLKYVLETYVGYDVTLSELNVGVMYQGLSDGNIDLITTAWLPLTHAQYIEKYTS